MIKVTKFGSTWCQPCSILKPIWNKIADSMSDVEFVTVDIDEEPELATTMSIRSVPTIVFEKDGVIVDTVVGLVNEKTLRDKIEELK